MIDFKFIRQVSGMFIQLVMLLVFSVIYIVYMTLDIIIHIVFDTGMCPAMCYEIDKTKMHQE